MEDQAQYPAEQQAPIANELQKTIVGDNGYEQQPGSSLRDGVTVNTPVATSAPPPELQSGIPLAEDRAAGVTADEAPPTAEDPDVPDTPSPDGEPPASPEA